MRESPSRSDARLELARLLKLQGRLTAAKGALAGGLRAKQGAEPLRAMLAQLLRDEALEARSEGRNLRAERLLRRAHEVAPTDASRESLAAALLERSSAEAAAGRLAKAQAAAEEAGRVDPRSRAVSERRAELAAERAAALAAGGRALEAESLLKTALRSLPGAAAPKRALVELLRRRAGESRAAGDGERAERALTEALETDPLAFEARRELASLLRERAAEEEAAGRRAPALKLWARAQRAARAGATARSDRFRALARAGAFTEAFAEAERLLDAGATVYEVRAFLNPWEEEPTGERRADAARRVAAVPGEAYAPWRACYLGFLTGRLEPFYELERADPKRYGWMLYRSGQSLLCQERFEDARRHFEAALACRPVEWRAASFLAETLLCAGKADEALAQLEAAARLAPRDEAADVLSWRGAFDLWLGRYEAALDRLTWAAALGGRHAETWRGAALLKLGRAKEALAALDAAVAADPQDREARVWRAETLRALGRHKEAVAEASRAPVGFWARVNRALARAALGDASGAAEDLAALPKLPVERGSAGLPASAPLTARLEAVLAKARGFRREDYGDSIWTNSAA